MSHSYWHRGQSPLFVLGHWRNGTTYLHNLLCVDRRFAFPNNFQTCFPHTFLSSEAWDSRIVSFFFPRRRPMDNVEWSLQSPQEDEFALCVMTLKSPYLSWIFPRQRASFEKYLTMRRATDSEIAEWQAAFDLFVRKLTFKYERPLILKSPPHTARIRLLLRMFPDARFVHIHRHPYVVFQSSKRTLEVNCDWHCLQRPRAGDFDAWVIRQYREMYDAYFEERRLIPEGRFVEVGFEELEKDPVGQVRRIYQVLGLPEFRVVQPDLEGYVASLAGYKKNTFPELPEALRSRIAGEWKACFEAWGYAP